MGSKTIVFCDLCKQQTEVDTFIEVAFKKPGQRKSKPYDICQTCANLIQSQLVGETELSGGWGFTRSLPQSNALAESPPARSIAETPPAESIYLNDEAFVAAKQKEVADMKKPMVEKPKTSVAKSDKDGVCLHYNKTAPRLDETEAFFIRECKKCHQIFEVPKR